MKDKKELLISYIKTNVLPILVDFISGEDINGSIILPSNIDVKELNGYYSGEHFIAPKWMDQIFSTKSSKVLIIDKIDNIDKKEQMKFYELLKYRKISTFELPNNCVILVTADEINKEKICEEIYSLVVHI